MMTLWGKRTPTSPNVSYVIALSAITAASALLLMLAIVQVSRLELALRQSNERLRRATELLRYVVRRS